MIMLRRTAAILTAMAIWFTCGVFGNAVKVFAAAYTYTVNVIDAGGGANPTLYDATSGDVVVSNAAGNWTAPNDSAALKRAVFASSSPKLSLRLDAGDSAAYGVSGTSRLFALTPTNSNVYL
jgi:hypothetical protein